MKILWLSHLLPYPPKSGVLMRSYHLIREIARYNEVDLLAFNQRASISPYFKSAKIGEEKAKEHLSKFVSKITCFNIPTDSGPLTKNWLAMKSLFTKDPYTINWLKSEDYSCALSNHIKAKKYDVIHFDTISLAPYWDPNIRMPCLLDHHNVESHMLLRRTEHENNILKKIYFYQEGKRLEKYERKMLSSFDHHIVCSRDDELRLLSLDNSLNTTVIPNGISMPSELPPRNSVNPVRLLFIGGLNWYPNRDAIHYFLDNVWPRIIVQNHEIVFDIIGKYPSNKIRRYADSDRRVIVHGFVDDISAFYESASIYICPIRDGGGTKLKILDALAHRLPLVANRIACEGLDIVDGVHALLSQDPRDMTEKILLLLRNPKMAQTLGENGYFLVKNNYEFSAIGRKLSELYTSMAKRDKLNDGSDS